MPTNVEQIAHGRFIIRSALVGGEWQARAFDGARSVGEIQSGKSRAEAIEKSVALLDARTSATQAGRGSDGSPSASEYAEAFGRLGKLAPSYEAMLEAHLRAPDFCITATQLAEAAGYENFNAANLHYGKLAADLAYELNYSPPKRDDGTTMWTYTLATPARDLKMDQMVEAIVRRFDDKHFEWRLRPQVVEALGGSEGTN